MKYNTKYELVYPENEEIVHFKIIDGTFRETQFLIDTIRIQEEGDEAVLKFNLDIVEGDKLLVDNVDFCNLVGDIIVNELEQSIASKDFELKSKTNEQ